MKIMFLIDHFGNGGAERVVSVLSDEMIKQNYTVYVTVNFDEKNYKINEQIKYLVNNTKHENRVLRKIDRLFSLRNYLKTVQPDVVLSFGYYMNMYALISSLFFRKHKLIISERTDPSMEPSSVFMRTVRNFIYRYADVLVCQTDMAKDYFPSYVKKRATVIPNPIKENLPSYDPLRVEKKIINACRLEDQKNLELLIDAFSEVHRQYPDYRLVIYGDGSKRNELEKKVQEMGLSEVVSLPGFSNNIHDEMKRCALFVSSSNYEGISNSMLEAMGIGVPVVCTDCPVGGAAMMIHHLDDGLLVPVNDLERLTEAMLYVLSNRDKSISMGTKAKYVNDEYSVKVIAKKWIDLL